MKTTWLDWIVLAAVLAAVAILAAAVNAQPQAPPVVPMPPQAPPVRESPPLPDTKLSVYENTLRSAWLQKRPAVIFVGHAGTSMGRKFGTPVVSCSVEYLDDVSAKCILISVPSEHEGRMAWKTTLDAGASDAEIRAAIEGRQVQPMARPFRESSSPQEGGTADGSGPWLPVGEQKRIRGLLPKGIKAGNVKFYSLTPLYQKMWTENNGRSRYNVPAGFDFDWPSDLRVSGGMAGLRGWKSYKGLDLPEGAKITVWTEDADVRAFSLVPRTRWAFPRGTVAYDVLTNSDKVFEVRTRTKAADGWETKVTFKDADAAPNGFHGAGRACASCHRMPAAIIDIPGKVYRHAVWGDDTVFSWRATDDAGNIDRRWPIEVK